eukprot:48969-Pleurochrysis_carterae.AAC.2
MEATSARRTATALEWFADFLASTERTPFVDPTEAGGARYNHHTLVLFAEFMRQCGSRQRSRAGKMIRADTICGYMSAVKLLCSLEARCDIAPEVPGGPLAQALKRMRQQERPARLLAGCGCKGRHGAEPDRLGGSPTRTQPTAARGRNKAPQGARLRLREGPDVGVGLVAPAVRGEQGLPVGPDLREARHKAVPLPVCRRRHDNEAGEDPICA